MSPLIFHSDRLQIREFQAGDAEFIVRLVNTPGWLTFIGDKNVHTADEALGYLSNGPFESYRKYGFGMWHVGRKDNGESIGMCGLLKRQGLDHPDLGFAFLPEHQGNGYALEAANTTVAFGFNHFDLKTIFAITMRENNRAQVLLEKVGMSFERDVLLNTSGKEEELMLFAIRRPD